jgi:hypothetical protein
MQTLRVYSRAIVNRNYSVLISVLVATCATALGTYSLYAYLCRNYCSEFTFAPERVLCGFAMAMASLVGVAAFMATMTAVSATMILHRAYRTPNYAILE